MSKTYSNEAVQQILREATMMQKNNDISEQQLIEIASEVGISEATLQQAEQVWSMQQKAQEKQTKMRQAFIRFNLIPYLTVSIFLVLLNLVTSPRCFWSIYPILGWGLGVTIDGSRAFSAREKKRGDFLQCKR